MLARCDAKTSVLRSRKLRSVPRCSICRVCLLHGSVSGETRLFELSLAVSVADFEPRFALVCEQCLLEVSGGEDRVARRCSMCGLARSARIIGSDCAICVGCAASVVRRARGDVEPGGDCLVCLCCIGGEPVYHDSVPVGQVCDCCMFSLRRVCGALGNFPSRTLVGEWLSVIWHNLPSGLTSTHTAALTVAEELLNLLHQSQYFRDNFERAKAHAIDSYFAERQDELSKVDLKLLILVLDGVQPAVDWRPCS